jgi:hypothetical protein
MTTRAATEQETSRPMRTQRPARSSRLPAALGLVLTFALCMAPPASAQDERVQSPIEVEEWSIWVGTPTQPAVNASRAYANAMPGPVGTSRPKLEGENQAGRFPISPISVVRFFGEPARDIDVDLRVKAGNLLAHWPPGKERGGRIQWFKSDLTATPPADVPLAYLPESHWFQELRKANGGLFLKSEASVERFIAYDAELTMPIPLKLRGGPEEFTIQNLTARRSWTWR